jgi:Kef-type K+ transport system membrane component KefB
MESLISFLVILIIAVIVVGFLLYVLRRALTAFVPDAKLQEMIWIIVLLVVFLAVVYYFFSGASGLKLPSIR